MGIRRLVLCGALLVTAGCGAAPPAARDITAPTLEITPAPTEPPELRPSATPEPPTPEPPTPTAAPSAEPSPAAPTEATAAPTAAPTEPPTAAATATAPLFFEPTSQSGPSPEPTATAAPTEPAATPAAAIAAARGTATITPQPAAARAPASQPVRLQIESIALDYKLVPVGLDANRLPVVPDHDVGWYTYGASPGQGENVVLWAHVLRFRSTPNIPAPFARLKELSAGDAVTLFDAQGVAHRYVVTQQVWVTPDQVEYMLPRGREQVTMISCIGDKVIQDGTTSDMTHRLITIAEPE